jgi:hypothetical protein
MIDRLEDNTIFVVPSNIKNSIIKDIRVRFGLANVKFMDITQFKNQFYFTYDNRTIYYLMKKYKWKYEVCLVYLNNLYYITDREYKYEKLIFLRNLKRELDENNLLIYDNLFKKSLKNKNVVVYGFSLLSRFYLKMFEDVSNITSVEILDREFKEYNRDDVYEFNTLEDEVNFVAINIIELINKGVDINKIKLANISSEYNNAIIKIFDFYHIPVYLKRNISLYSTSVGKYFFECLDSDINITLDKVKTKFYKQDDEYNLIVDVLNKYSWCDEYNDIKDMLVHEFKNTYLKEKKRDKQVECIELKNNIIDEDYYVFLMNFNQGSIPTIYKDEDYITDTMKDCLDTLDSTGKLNLDSRMEMLKIIKGICNLYISYKKESPSGSYIISNLNDELCLNINSDFKDRYKYSNLYNRLRLASDIDEFVKYGTISDKLASLYHNYQDISYLTYNNKFTGIDKKQLEEYLDHKLLLSYSTIDNYYRCGFRYYLDNILKLSIYEDTFMTTLGSLFHFILSEAFNKDDFDLDNEYEKYIDSCGKSFSIKERFFLDKLKGELHFIIDTIKKQMEFCDLKNQMYEEKIYVDKSDGMKITFMGIVDKIVYDNIDDKCIVSIIDYKTGNPQININNTIYGIEMQLPIYLYLVKNSEKFKDVYVAGFYLQKVLNNEILRDYKHTYEELKMSNLRLQGYSNEEVNILDKFDSGFENSRVVRGLKTTSKGFANYSKVIDNDKIDKLVSIVDSKIDDATKDIREAKFDINPKRIGKINYGCEFCKFKDICFMTENDIVNLKEYKKLEFLGGEDDDTGEA